MLTVAVVGLFFLMLLAPCLFALLGSRRRDDEQQTRLSRAEPENAEEQVTVNASPPLPGQPVPFPQTANVPFVSAAMIDAAAESARAEELRTMLAEAEAAARQTARTRHAERVFDLHALRRLVADAEAEASTAQLVAAQARAAALTAAFRAATARADAAAVRAKAAAEMADRARMAAHDASRAVAETRESYARQGALRMAEAESRAQDKVPDDPSMHYPRARVNRRAA